MKGELEIHRHRFRPKEPTDDEFWVIFAIGSSIKSPKKMLLKGKISWVTSSHLAQATLVDIKKKGWGCHLLQSRQNLRKHKGGLLLSFF
jgi:hypothetical protein